MVVDICEHKREDDPQGAVGGRCYGRSRSPAALCQVQRLVFRIP